MLALSCLCWIILLHIFTFSSNAVVALAGRAAISYEDRERERKHEEKYIHTYVCS